MKCTVFITVVVSLLALFSTGWAQTPDEDEYSDLVGTIAAVPLTLDVGSSSLLGSNTGFLVGASVYPVPLIAAGEFNLDLSADLTYRVGVAPVHLLLGAGPRYKVVASDWVAGRGEVGTYAGAGVLAGVELDLGLGPVSLLNLLVKGGVDYTFGLTEGATPNQASFRLGVGLGIPLIGASATF